MITLAETDTLRILTLVGAVIAVLFVATVIIMVVRKKILSTDQTPATGLIMDDFRRLHASGQLSDDEFQVLKTRMAAKMKAAVPSKGSVHDELEKRPPTPTQRPQRTPQSQSCQPRPGPGRRQPPSPPQ